MRLRIISPTGETSERVVEAARARLGRDPACEVAFDTVIYPRVSGEHAHIERTASGLVLTPRSRSNKTLLNDQPIDGPAALKVGDRIRLGFTGPTIEILADEVPRPKSPPLSPAPATKPAVRTGLSAAEGGVAREQFQRLAGVTPPSLQTAIVPPREQPRAPLVDAKPVEQPGSALDVQRSTSSGPVSKAGGRLHTVKLVLEIVAVLVTIIGGIIGTIAVVWGSK